MDSTSFTSAGKLLLASEMMHQMEDSDEVTPELFMSALGAIEYVLDNIEKWEMIALKMEPSPERLMDTLDEMKLKDPDQRKNVSSVMEGLFKPGRSIFNDIDTVGENLDR